MVKRGSFRVSMFITLIALFLGSGFTILAPFAAMRYPFRVLRRRRRVRRVTVKEGGYDGVCGGRGFLLCGLFMEEGIIRGFILLLVLHRVMVKFTTSYHSYIIYSCLSLCCICMELIVTNFIGF